MPMRYSVSTSCAPIGDFMFVCGIDIGYSNLKVAAGPAGGPPRVVVRPAGAAPEERLGTRIGGQGAPRGGEAPILVDVAGETWAVAVEPERFEHWQRPLHEDYAGSPGYRALAKAALHMAGRLDVEVVVTGLPVSQATDTRRRDALRRMLEGRHFLASGTVEVGEVRVIPQPVGAYLDLVYGSKDEDVLDRIESGAVIVLDAGYYSFDWALIVQGELRRDASGTSLEAMSVLLDRAGRAAADEAGGKPNPAGLEAALRAGRAHILQAGRRVSVSSLVGRASSLVCGVALETMRQALRREIRSVDLVLIAGGGGAIYGSAVASLFPGALAVVAENPVSANARGFFHYAA